MARYSSLVVQYGGFAGQPGYMRFNFLELVDPTAVSAASTGVRTFLTGLVAYAQTTWSWTMPTVCQHFDVDTGKLNQEVPIASPGPTVVGTAANTSTYTGGAGAVIFWTTGAILAGRKVRGRTFIVPIVLAFEANGTLIGSVQAAIQSAALGLKNGSGYTLGVYHRGPLAGGDPDTAPSAIVPVTSAVVPDRSAFLRSRRT